MTNMKKTFVVNRRHQFPESGNLDWSNHRAGDGEMPLIVRPIKAAENSISKTSPSNQTVGEVDIAPAKCNASGKVFQTAKHRFFFPAIQHHLIATSSMLPIVATLSFCC